tara:strand:- start:1276 stop:2472 length:1197 start_codon:yes stop_codon:yes gene_type:complete
MSSLLEKAIIDAAALKEAALKSAEKLVVEKYATEVKEAVDMLISDHFEENINEQDLGAPAPDLGGGAGGDPFGFDSLPGEAPAAEEPAAAEPEADSAEEPLDPEDLMSIIPDAFNSSDDEVIQIKLDSLEAEMADVPDGPFAGNDELGDGEIGIDVETEEELAQQEEIPDVEVPLDDEDDIDIDITSDVVSEVLGELGLDEEEIDLDELLERVRVDFEPQKSGWAGTPESIMKEYEAMLLAREQDSEVKEENEELRKTVAALQKENKTLSSAAVKLQGQNQDYETAFNNLQEKLETMNVSNAKLLYINQALENASLNERQKRKIVEAISKAETVQEAKIVFETMNEAVATNLDVKKDATLNEVVSSRSTLLVAARKEQKNTNANPIYNRLQKLAGIKT